MPKKILTPRKNKFSSITQKVVGYAGYPPVDIINEQRDKGAYIIDLDNPIHEAPRFHQKLLPPNTCAIIKRILDNTIYTNPDLLIIDVGYGKCDAARAIANVIKMATNINIITTRNDIDMKYGTSICDSFLSPRQKAELILENLIDGKESIKLAKAESPPVALWGVPPADFNLYDLFPNGTILLGWIRCLENGSPANEELELEILKNIPTVFFAQTFCYKNILAKQLAAKYNGLYIDVDEKLSSSDRAKIGAFLRFNTKSHFTRK